MLALEAGLLALRTTLDVWLKLSQLLALCSALIVGLCVGIVVFFLCLPFVAVLAALVVAFFVVRATLSELRRPRAANDRR